MDLDDQIELDHLLFFDRKCRSCGEVKSLLDDYYLIRRDRGTLPSAYSYECKLCTIIRVKSKKKKTKNYLNWEYPDW